MENQQKIINQCTKIFSKVMKIPLKKVSDKSSIENVDGWDSLSHVQLISSLEKNFKIKVTPEEGIDAFNNFGEIVGFVHKKLKKKK
jgi:acyl carrier protein